MKRCCVAGLFLVLLIGAAFTKVEAGSAAAGSLGVTYDEGLSGKYFVTDKIGAWVGLGYNIVGADTIGRQPLQNFMIKLGVSYKLTNLGDKVFLNAFGELAEVCNNFETEGPVPVNSSGKLGYPRYNVWDTRVRVGILPEYFIVDRLSLSYKMGLQYIYHGTHYKVNSAGDGLEAKKNDHSEFGVFVSGLGVPSPMYAFFNISLTWYVF